MSLPPFHWIFYLKLNFIHCNSNISAYVVMQCHGHVLTQNKVKIKVHFCHCYLHLGLTADWSSEIGWRHFAQPKLQPVCFLFFVCSSYVFFCFTVIELVMWLIESKTITFQNINLLQLAFPNAETCIYLATVSQKEE